MFIGLVNFILSLQLWRNTVTLMNSQCTWNVSYAPWKFSASEAAQFGVVWYDDDQFRGITSPER